MSVTNYGELKSTIADFLNRSDLTSIIPTFIDFAESEFNRNLRVRQMVVRAQANIDSRFSAVPSDFVESKDMVLVGTNPVQPLEFITQQEMGQQRNETYTASAKPEFFTIVGGQFEFMPTPDSTYSLEMSYFGKIDALTADSDTNWLLTDYPDLYLYTSLMHSAPYLKDDERTSVWAQLATKAREELLARDTNASFNGSTPRIKIRSFG